MTSSKPKGAWSAIEAALRPFAKYHVSSYNGTPGLRPHYHAGYYAAFVIDPDGNVEGVSHGDSQLPAP